MTSVCAAIVVRNEALFLKESVLSIRDSHDEIIVVDHGSVDDSVEVIRELMSTLPQLRLFEVGNKLSMAQCRNLVEQETNCEWIQTWDADFVAYEDCDERPSLRAFLDTLRSEVDARTNLVLLTAPNIGPTPSTTIVGRERHGVAGDAKIYRRGISHFETGKYPDTFVSDRPLRKLYLNGDEAPGYFVHLDRLKLPERLLMRNWMFEHDKERFGGLSTLGFEDWLRAHNYHLDSSIGFLLKQLTSMVAPIDVDRWGALPKRLLTYDAIRKCPMVLEDGGIQLSPTYCTNNKLNIYLRNECGLR